MKLNTRLVPAVLSGLLGLLSWSSMRGPAWSQQGQPAQPDAACQSLPNDSTEGLGDGVKCDETIRVSKPLFDSEQNKSVRVLSYHLDFRKDNSVIGQVNGLVLVDLAGHQPIKVSVGGIDPKLADPFLASSVSAHSYDIYIGPVDGKTWGESSGKGDITASVLRTE